MQTTILSLDIGTTLAKAVLFDLSGCQLAVTEQTYQLQTPKPGWVELEPEALWQAVMQVIKTLGRRYASQVEIQAVALSTQGGSLIPVRADGSAAYNMITWLDRRSENVVKTWQQAGIDQRIRQVSGWTPQPGLPLTSICALRQEQLTVFEDTAKFLSVNDYLVYQLTGKYCTNPSMAGEMLLTNIQTGQWDDELCNLAGIHPDQLSPIKPSDAVCGVIHPEICRATGLATGTPLINGGQDHSCEALALGMISAGKYWLACGTAWVINGVTTRPNIDELPAEMALNHHVIPGCWVGSQFLGGLGAGMAWWINQVWQDPNLDQQNARRESYATFNAAVMQTQPGSSGVFFFPVSGTPRSDMTPGGYARLRLDHTRAELGRAVLESAAYEVRWAVEYLRGFGLRIDQMWMVGGATRNPIWPKILADVTGMPILLIQYSHGPALGAAILAANGLGLLEGSPNWVSAQQISPNLANQATYQDCYTTYCHMTERSNP